MQQPDSARRSVADVFSSHSGNSVNTRPSKYDPRRILRAEPVRYANLSRQDVIILVVGVTGSGKSTFVEKATGGRFGESHINHSLKSSKTLVTAVRVVFSDGSTPIVLVDTPGFDATTEDDWNILGGITGWLRPKDAPRFTVAGIIYLHDVSQIRVKYMALERLSFLKDFCGKNLCGTPLLATTMWPNMDESNSHRKECDDREKDFLGKCWKPAYPGDSNNIRFKNTIESAWEVINRLIENRSAVWEGLFPAITDKNVSMFKTLQYRNPAKISSVDAVEVKEITGKDMVIIVMGPTGTGKSTIIDTVTREKYESGRSPAEVGHNLVSTTNQIKALRIKFHDDVHVVLVDTPGFDNTHLSDYDVLKCLVEWFRELRQGDGNITGVLYLQRISDNRMPSSPMRNPIMFRKLCGDHFIKNVVLTTTMWPKPGEADEDVNLYIDRENNLIKEFWSDMFAQGSNIFRFDATPKSAWDIINYLIVADTEKRWLQIRTKLVEEGKMLAATEEGRDVLDDLLGKLSELLKRIDGSEVGEDAIKNVSRVNEFRQLHNKALKQIRQLEADPSRLDESLLKRLIALLTRIFN